MGNKFKEINDETKEIIKTLISKGKSIKEVSKIVNISPATLSRRQKEIGFIPNGRNYYSYESNPRWRGGFYKCRGYVFVLDRDNVNARGNGYIPRYVKNMQEYLKRPLSKSEGVHHIDGNKENDNIENLYLYNGHLKHVKMHNQLEKIAYELIQKGIIKFKEGEYFYEI